MTDPAPAPFTLSRPDRWAGGVIFASPHSGRDYPDWFLAESGLDAHLLRSSEDAFVDRLIAPAVAAGAVVLAARVPRCLVDLNRGLDELDPLAVTGVPPRPPSPRIQSGLGVIPRVVGQGRPIRRAPLSRAEAARRLDAYWQPYHAVLGTLMAEAAGRFGRAVLIDVHSMPREALAHLPGPRPQIVIGDRNGLSAAPAVTGAVAEALTAAGFAVRHNSPFAGAYVASAYGRPAQNRHVVQIEIDRALYMDESRIAPHAGFGAFAARFGAVLAALALMGAGEPPAALAAE
ncbi:N-formylglutamate amidohydrolase [Paracoccus endophyticus]|uniref:N-formylglutamate amidohydrolase n=1 Tax=Paracoccus endophyticus TaxID=2233774 RepID=UPI000DD606EE|nr:N-formylglutamate amidohydrolase [Paracoccus endophyticus]